MKITLKRRRARMRREKEGGIEGGERWEQK